MFRLAERFAAAGASVTVMTTVRPGPWFARLADLGVEAVAMSHPPLRTLHRHAAEVGRRLAARRFDAVLLNHSLAAQSSLGMLPDGVVAIPVIHNDDGWVYDVACSNAELWNAAIAVGRRVHDAVVTRLPSRPVRLIPNGVEFPASTPHRALPDIDRPVALAYVGRLSHRQKGVFLLPEIVAACDARGRAVRLTIAGDGPDRAELERLIAGSSSAARIELVGPLSPDRSVDLMARSDVLLMPSFYEGLPIALLESMAQGCVPVVTDLSGTTSDVVRDGIDGRLIRSGDAAAFAQAVVDITSDGPRLAAMRESARERIRRDYSVESMARGYLDLIDEALGGRMPLPRSRAAAVQVDTTLMRARDRLPRLAGDALDAFRRSGRPRPSPVGTARGVA